MIRPFPKCYCILQKFAICIKNCGIEYVFLLCLTTYILSAKASDALPPLERGASNHIWVFSGLVLTEQGERYGYFFKVDRKGPFFHALATVVNADNQVVLFAQDSAVEHTVQDAVINWRIGRAFLWFNAENNTWVFGIKMPQKTGFHFKVNALQQHDLAKMETLREGVEALVDEIGPLDGHMRVREESTDLFVTSGKVWFQHFHILDIAKAKQVLSDMVCQLDDGNAFYALTLENQNTIQNLTASWRNHIGKIMPISQFVTLKNQKQTPIWKIHIPSPALEVALHNALDASSTVPLVVGMTEGKTQGFCGIYQHREDIGTPSQRIG